MVNDDIATATILGGTLFIFVCMACGVA